MYDENKGKSKKEKIENINKELKEQFESEEQLQNFINENLERKKRNLIERRKRLYRKAYLQVWSYFCVFKIKMSLFFAYCFANTKLSFNRLFCLIVA